MHPATAQSRSETIPAQPVVTAHESEDGHHFEWIEYARVALVGIAAAVAWTRTVPQFHGFDFISLSAALIGGYPVEIWTRPKLPSSSGLFLVPGTGAVGLRFAGGASGVDCAEANWSAAISTTSAIKR